MTTDEQKAAYIHAQAVAAHLEMEAMKAANWMCQQQGYTIAYGESAFLDLIEKYSISQNAILELYDN